jgi:hypothetical protein
MRVSTSMIGRGEGKDSLSVRSAGALLTRADELGQKLF